MSKEELEAFRYIVKELQRLITDREYYIFNIYPKVEILEQYFLKMYNLETINPSEALKCLETLGSVCPEEDVSAKEIFYEEFETIKQALIKAQEQEKENTRYKQLEEQLGCPLEVIEQLFSQDFIYFKYPANVQIMKVKVCKGLSYGTNLGWHVTCIYDNIVFEYLSLKDYKKTWWLKEDRSE